MIGKSIGSYQVVAKLGEGGMGEVYRAHDPRLGRDVAIKVLPEAMSRDPDRLQRFEQEARAAAGLNHPNILAVHDVGLTEGTPYVVSELLEGETLREAIPAGGLPLRTALAYAAQIADALAAAHAKGIVHRDLKPENVFVTEDGRVKVLDFGLAKQMSTMASGPAEDDTRISMETMPGMVMGTAGYMSPEQAAGRPVDFRSDQFSLGTLAYEMLTGTQPFRRATLAQTMAAVIDEDPEPIPGLNSRVPRSAIALVERCLEKAPGDRFGSTLDLARDLHAALDDLQSGRLPEVARRPALWWPAAAIAGVLVTAALAWWAAGGRRASDQAGAGEPLPTMTRLTQLTTAAGVERFPAWSPDGTRLAYSADVEGHRKIFIRTIASRETQQVTFGAADDIQPTWSPDGAAIAFVRARQPDVKLEPGDVFGLYDGGDIWRVDLATGEEARLLDDAYGPAYSPDGRWLAVDASWAGPRRIWLVDSRGHNPRQVSSDDSEAAVHIRPRWSPDGSAMVFQHKESTLFGIKAMAVPGGTPHWVTGDPGFDIGPVWAPTGGAIYFSSQRGGGINLWRVPVDASGAPQGPPVQVTTGAGQDVEVAVAPDGRQLAFVTLKQNADLWELPLTPAGVAAGAPRSLVSTSREDSRGAWSPDGTLIAFNSDRDEHMNIWLHPVEGGGDRQLTSGPGGDYQPRWSPDGETLVFFSSRGGTPDIWSVQVDTGTLAQLTDEPSVELNPAVSPDGTAIAFQSDLDGRLAPWVMNVDGREPRQLAAVGLGGHYLQWRPNGASLLFRLPGSGPQGLTTIVEVPPGGGNPQRVAEVAGGSHFSFSPDQSRVIDVVGHKSLWVSPLGPGSPAKVFEFEDASIRIDYPVWAPDGRAVLFDRFQPEGGDIWMLSGH